MSALIIILVSDNEITYLMKKYLFQLDALVVWCPTWLNRSIDHLGRATCTAHLIFAQNHPIRNLMYQRIAEVLLSNLYTVNLGLQTWNATKSLCWSDWSSNFGSKCIIYFIINNFEYSFRFSFEIFWLSKICDTNIPKKRM